jgi:hypothetical protein
VDKAQEDQVTEWLGRIARAQKFHFVHWSQCRKGHLAVGVIVVVLSIISAALAFGLPNIRVDYATKLAGLVSVMVSVIAGIQTFLNLERLSEAHLKAAKNYNKIKIDLENFLRFPPGDDQIKEGLQGILSRWCVVVGESPALPPKLYTEVGLPEESS